MDLVSTYHSKGAKERTGDAVVNKAAGISHAGHWCPFSLSLAWAKVPASTASLKALPGLKWGTRFSGI
jgi:hypothetical protein